MAPCARCGTFLCGACTELVGETACCADCVARLHQHGPPSRVVQVLIGMGLVGFFCFAACGPVAPVLHLVVAVLGFWLPTRELRRIQRGEGPARGTWQAKAARVAAGLNLVLALAWIAWFAFYATRQDFFR